MKSILVQTQKPYRIYIGEEDALDRFHRELTPKARSKKAMVVSQNRILKHHRGVLAQHLPRDFSIDFTKMGDGERYKSLRYTKRYYLTLLEKGYDRGSSLIAFGGGVVGDFTGFIAASYLRGIDFYQIPTTLLAAVDASVGGKVAVNIGKGKNIVGFFYQPRGVYIHTGLFQTLPVREVKIGWVEIIKSALIWDKKFFDYLYAHRDRLLSMDNKILTEAIYRSVSIKAKVVSADEKESNLRQILNFGHTIGHSIESIYGYRKYTHGEAVAIGLITEILLSIDLLGFPEQGLAQTYAILKSLDLDLTLPPKIDSIIGHIRYDKKNKRGKNQFVLLKKIGKALTNQHIEEPILRHTLQRHNEVIDALEA